MKYLLSCISILFAGLAFSQNAYEISITIEGLANQPVLLANHYGNKQYYKDTTGVTNANGTVVFTGEEQLPHGIYLAVLPNSQYFEFVIGDDQNFKLNTKQGELVPAMKVEGSKENSYFFNDLAFLGSQRAKYDEFKTRLDAAKSDQQKEAIKAEITAFDKSVKKQRAAKATANKDMVYGKIVLAMQDTEIPEDYNKADSTFPYRYMRKHYWDNVDFSEEGLIYSPVFHNKMESWIKKWTYQIPDSIIASSDIILQKAKANDEIFKYTLVWLLNEHAGSKIMCMDKVYVHLVNEYYAKGMADWVDEEQLDKIKKDAKALEPVVCGAKVPDIVAYTNKDGEVKSLYTTKAERTILVFWDSGCGHCKKTLPKIEKLHEAYQKHGLEVVAVTIQTEDEKEDWYEFLKENDMEDMVNLQDFDFSNKFRLDYTIKSTPQIFLLDEDKEVLAKKLSVGQMAEFLDKDFGTDLKAPFVKMDEEAAKKEEEKKKKREEAKKAAN